MADNKLSLIVSFIGQDKLSGALKNIIGLGKSGDQALKGMFRNARDLKGEMKALDKELARTSGDVTPLINKQRELAAQLEKVNAQIDRQKRLNNFDANTRRIGARGQELQGAGASNMAGGAAMAAPLVLAGAAAMDFSSGMVDIQQKAGLTNAETEKMAGNIMALARATHQLPEDMRAGVDVLAAKGLDPRAAVEMIGPIGKLGTAFKVDLADGAAAAFANMNNLKVGMADTGKALDIMAAGANLGSFEVADMARNFPALTAQMQALGESGTGAVADLTAALQVAMNTAGSADEAANNIANLMQKMNSPTVIKAFAKNFGVDLPSAMKKFQAQGMTSMEAFAAATRQATGGDMKKLGFVLEDRQAQMGVMALIQNMEQYRRIRDQVAQGGGTINAAFKQREARDASVAWAAFKGTMSELAITLGANLLPAATNFFGAIGDGVRAISAWTQANPGAARALTTLLTAFVAGKIALGGLQYAFGSMLSTVATLRNVFGMAQTMFGGLRMAAMFLARGVMQAGMMMLANPMVAAIVLIGVALAALAYVVYRNWDKIKAAFATGWNWVKSTLAAAPAWLTNLGKMMMTGLLAMIDPFGLSKRLLDVARNGITAFKNFFGIKSPSRLMMAMGGHMTAGLADGITRSQSAPLRAMGRMATAVAGAGALSIAAPAIAQHMVPPIARAPGPLAAPAQVAPPAASEKFRQPTARLMREAPAVLQLIARPMPQMAASPPLKGTRTDRGTPAAAQPWMRPPPPAAPAAMPPVNVLARVMPAAAPPVVVRPLVQMAKTVVPQTSALARFIPDPVRTILPPIAPPAPVPFKRTVDAIRAQPLAPARPARATPLPAAGLSIGALHIHQQPGEDAEDLIDRIIRRLKEEEERRRRRGFRDDF